MDTSGKNIMLVDDDDRVAQLEIHVLEQLQFRVTRVSNGKVAIETIRKSEQIELILMDIDLGPGIDGLITAKEIQKIREIPIIFLSSHTDETNIDLTEQITAYGYLHKSAKPSVYLSFIKSAFRLFYLNHEIKKKNAVLASKIKQYDTCIANTPAAIALFDTEMHYLSTSKSFCDDYHITDTNIIGKSHYEVFPEIPDRVKEIHQRCLHGEILSNKNAAFYRNNGSFDFVRWEMRPWYNGDGEIGGVVLFSVVLNKFIADYKQHQSSLPPEQTESCTPVKSR